MGEDEGPGVSVGRETRNIKKITNGAHGRLRPLEGERPAFISLG